MGILRLFRKLLGVDEIEEPYWEQFAKAHRGSRDYRFGEEVIHIPYKNLEIEMSSYTHYVTVGTNSYESFYLRAQLNFFNLGSDFQLQITQEGWVEKVGKLFGTKDIKIRSEEFDRRFYIKSNDELKAHHFLSDTKLREVIMEKNPIRIEVTKEQGIFDESPAEGCHMIYLIESAADENFEKLESCLSLMKLLADAAIKSGFIRY